MATVKIKTTKVKQPKRVKLNTYLTHITSRCLGGKKTCASEFPFHVQSVCGCIYTSHIQEQVKILTKEGRAFLIFINMKNAQNRKIKPFSSLLFLWHSPYFPLNIFAL